MLVLLDRDGVLNEERADFVKSPGELKLIDGAGKAIARLNAAGHRVVVVTNQSAVGRGLIDEAMLDRIHDTLRQRLAAEGGRLDAILHCSDPPWAATDRRKPGAGMIREAMALFHAASDDCLMIGDSLRDLQAAAALGVRRCLVRTGKGAATQAAGLPEDVLPVSVYDHLAAAVDAILDSRKAGGE